MNERKKEKEEGRMKESFNYKYKSSEKANWSRMFPVFSDGLWMNLSASEENLRSQELDKNVFVCVLGQCFSTAGTRPGTGTWRPSYRDLKCFKKLKTHLKYVVIY